MWKQHETMEFFRNKLLSTLFVAFSYSSPWLVYVHHCHFSLSPLSPLGATLRWCSCAAEMVSTLWSLTVTGATGCSHVRFFECANHVSVSIFWHLVHRPSWAGPWQSTTPLETSVTPFWNFVQRHMARHVQKHPVGLNTRKWWLHVTTTWKLRKVNCNLQRPTITPQVDINLEMNPTQCCWS